MASVLTNAGRALLIQRLLGSGTEPKQMGWGTGAGTSAVGDTTLFAEKALDLSSTTGSRGAGTSSSTSTAVNGDTYQLVGTLIASGSGTVTNAGSFDNTTIGSGNLFFKTDFTGIALNSGDGITFTFKVQLA